MAIRRIYALLDPRESPMPIRYVGCTVKRLSNRLQAHVNEAVDSQAVTPKLSWIRELLLEDQRPLVMELQVVPNDADWEEVERSWIERFKDQDLLTNTTVGGIGVRGLPQEVRDRISQSLRGRPLSEEHKAKLRITSTGRRHTDEAKQKIAASKVGLKLGPLPDEVRMKLKEAMGSLVWINDGKQNRRVKPDAIPAGWQKGRAPKDQPKQSRRVLRDDL